MKRYDHLYEKIYDLENLRKAHQHAKKGKGWYREVQEIDKEPDKYLKQIQEMLINHTYKTSDYEVFYKQDGKKLRKIYKLPYFPDRICQWAILQVIEPCIINNLTADTYSAIPNRGIHKGLTKLQTAMWNDPEECKYCLKLDARHYYQSINHDLLKEKYSRTLLIFMGLDYISGLLVAGVFKNSPKTDTGSLESKAGWKGLCRKCMTLVFVLVAYRLDLVIGTNYIRDAVIIAFIANETISLVENAGLMGLPLPEVISKAIDILQKNTGSGE